MSLVYDKFKTILPLIEPVKSKDLDFLGADTISRVELENLTLLPKDTPKHLLVHLAYMYDVYIEGLSEQEQRKLIEISFEIHRHLGTVYALNLAFEVIGIKAEIIEWYNTNNELPPYTFGLKMKSMDNRGIDFLLNYINRFKNERSRLKKLSDGNCKGKAQYDQTKYDNSVFSDIQGVIVNGVRVCFQGNKDKNVVLNYAVSSYVLASSEKIYFYFSNRYDNFKYGGKKDTFSFSSAITRNIDKKMITKRQWQGAWLGHVSDEYRPSFSRVTSVDKQNSLNPTVASLMEAFTNREVHLKIKVEKERQIDKELRLQRQWQGTWTGHVTDAYAVAIL